MNKALPKAKLPAAATIPAITAKELVDAAKAAGQTKTASPTVTNVRKVSATSLSTTDLQMFVQCAFNVLPHWPGIPGQIMFHKDMGGVCSKKSVTLKFVAKAGDVHVASCQTGDQTLWKVTVSRTTDGNTFNVAETAANRDDIHTAVVGSAASESIDVTFEIAATSNDWQNQIEHFGECSVGKIVG